MKDLINEIAAALKILGISGRITLHPIADLGRVKVAVNGKYFGVWDSKRKTFVD